MRVIAKVCIVLQIVLILIAVILSFTSHTKNLFVFPIAIILVNTFYIISTQGKSKANRSRK